MLIVEVDGLTHQFEEVAEKDKDREKNLRMMGFTVIRFNDDEVRHDIGNVERTLIQYVDTFKKRE